MIPAPPNLYARYKHTGGPRTFWTYRRVIAFDDYGNALVVGQDHQIAGAASARNYDGVTDTAPAPHAYTAIMPAAGWRVEWTEPDGTVWTEPLAGWALKDGDVVPLYADPSGATGEVGDTTGGKHKIYHLDTTSPYKPDVEDPSGHRSPS